MKFVVFEEKLFIKSDIYIYFNQALIWLNISLAWSKTFAYFFMCSLTDVPADKILTTDNLKITRRSLCHILNEQLKGYRNNKTGNFKKQIF